jgi:hypothetical protein
MNHTLSRPGALSDQRRSTRTRVKFAARYVSSNLNLEGHVTDISAEGLFFSSDYLDDQGETVQVWVETPFRPDPLELRGEVRWINDTPAGGGMGLKLMDVSMEDRELLNLLADRSDAPAIRSGHA